MFAAFAYFALIISGVFSIYHNMHGIEQNMQGIEQNIYGYNIDNNNFDENKSYDSNDLNNREFDLED